MSQELVRLIPNEHRTLDEDVYVVFKRSVNASKPDEEVSLVRLRYEILPLNYAIKVGESQNVVPLHARTTMDAIVDRKDGTIEFSIQETNSALPEELQGGGIGSYVLSEMIRWGQGISPQLKVIPIQISDPQNAGSGREAKLKAFFGQLGFAIINKQGVGLFAAAEAVANLNTHVNEQKLERVNLISWGNEWLERNISLANQLREEGLNANFYKEQINSLREQKSGRQPFWAGLMCGMVAGLIVGILIAI